MKPRAALLGVAVCSLALSACALGTESGNPESNGGTAQMNAAPSADTNNFGNAEDVPAGGAGQRGQPAGSGCDDALGCSPAVGPAADAGAHAHFDASEPDPSTMSDDDAGVD